MITYRTTKVNVVITLWVTYRQGHSEPSKKKDACSAGGRKKVSRVALITIWPGGGGSGVQSASYKRRKQVKTNQ